MKIRALVTAVVIAAVAAACSSTVTSPEVNRAPQMDQGQDTVPSITGGHTMGSGG